MPMVTIPNIFEYKNLRLLIAIPIALLIVGLYLSTKLVLDSSLSGGVTVVLQANTTVNTATLATQIGTALNVPAPFVVQSPGGLQVTIANNQSLANAETHLINFYQYKANYSAFSLNATAAQSGLQHSPGNQTLLTQLSNAQIGMNKSLSGMNLQITLEFANLIPFIPVSPTYNTTNIDKMSSVAQGAYTNASFVYKQKILTTLHGLLPFSTYSYQQVTPTLGKYFLSQVEAIIIVAFILISIAVFVIFRSITPSIAIVFGAGNDMIIALGSMVLLHIPLGIASVGGLLMLIGYAIDTEILTAIRILKRKEGTPEQRAYGAMKTGLTMTGAAIASFAVLFVVSLAVYVPTYYEISGVVLFGLIGDILTTWFGNAPMILLYAKRKAVI